MVILPKQMIFSEKFLSNRACKYDLNIKSVFVYKQVKMFVPELLIVMGGKVSTQEETNLSMILFLMLFVLVLLI